ncbi:hypothetical protein DSL64_20380 [Dyadobacter luteus]|jgi:hypothetical protein|uniref:DUF2442 domain-containing protein n=1 Tax=Dyadobacter luteus TaxID=2259619 RepID=A0A3D8Y741_9BACT|nr:hypothetical protein [Dyadobacter luteus]REA58717.1 hypothetical protein DSL64_20380 [Dyadobacter luteus]
MNPRIEKIISIDPFIIRALWTDKQVRTIDFGRFLSEYFDKEESIFHRILNKNAFLGAKTDGRTIYWEGITEMEDYNGEVISAPLDFCPDVLFEQSVLEE